MADRLLDNAKAIFRHVGERADAPFSMELWDGSVIPLGPHADPELRIRINGPGVIGAILRRPTLETVLRQYAEGGIDFAGGDMLTFIEAGRARKVRLKPGQFRKAYLALRLLPFLAAKGEKAAANAYAGDETGAGGKRDDSGYIRFHYDVGNDFYALFLDPEMQYSCAYFRDWQNPIETAQHDKLDMICRKLRLQPGERFLDVGSGWGGCSATPRRTTVFMPAA